MRNLHQRKRIWSSKMSDGCATERDTRLTAEFWCWVLDLPDEDYPTFLESLVYADKTSNRSLGGARDSGRDRR